MKSETAPFLFYNFGYFLYLVRDHTCARIVVPKIQLVPHLSVLLCAERAITIEGFLPVSKDGEYLAIQLRDLSISIGDPAPASLGRRQGTSVDDPDFDWIPRFSRTCCGVGLNPEWRQSSAVDSVIHLGGGELRAEPDAHTCERIHTWTLCDGTSHTQRVTNLTVYEVGSAEPVKLTFRNTRTPESEPIATATLALHTDLPPILLHVPVGKRDTKHVELSHLQATLALCLPTGGELKAPEKSFRKEPCSKLHANRALPPVIMKQFTDHDGTVECSGQQTCENP